ncbi:MAG: repeat domain protein [Myxococcales bacterium]|nr:repeat domain protein [Myxococcales bacterium]
MLVLVCVSCTGVLGLDRVVADTDGDGVLDDADNCIDTPNPDQLDFNHDGVGDACAVCLAPSGRDDDHDGIDDACDSCVGPGMTGVDSGGDHIDDGCEPCPAGTGDDIDHDGIDDACDACLDGPPHDEDGDGIADACDDCPTIADPMQAQVGDTDRVGDACDPDDDPRDPIAMKVPGLQVPRLFDGFGSDLSQWVNPAGWSVSSDQARASGTQVLETRSRVGDRYLVRTVVQLGVHDTTSTVDITAQTTKTICVPGQCTVAVVCRLDSTGLLALVTPDQATTTDSVHLDISGPITLELRTRNSIVQSPIGQPANVDVLCIGVDHNGTMSSPGRSGYPASGLTYSVDLDVTNADATFDYVWILSG